MSIDLVVPEVGESIHEVQVLRWKKRQGDFVEKDEELVEIETEKATVPVSAPAAGRLQEILKNDSEFAEVGDVLARLEPGDGAPAAAKTQKEPTPAKKPEPTAKKPEPPPQPAAERPAPLKPTPRKAEQADGRGEQRAAPTEPAKPTPPAARKPAPPAAAPSAKAAPSPDRQEQRVPMGMLRRTIARRLVEAQQTAALVSTFNEIDMQAVIDLRREYGESFKQEYDVKLGFMSFFVKAAVEGLKRIPEVNASIEDDTIVYRNYYDVGVAIGSGKGLVVPVLRGCERMSFAAIEHQIADFASRAQAGRLAPDELTGGTFTITNGGIYGSLLSTPIINPPQSGVLGLHSIQDRPVARDGQVVIRPMMYVALTYDHRLVDGREAVTFLKRIKDVIETPSRLFLEI
jgi:2-oxoglutarate dehydrogenase E2 component (dihydrolipoamide succinyltransferase)